MSDISTAIIDRVSLCITIVLKNDIEIRIDFRARFSS